MIYHVTVRTDDAVKNLLRIVNRKLTYNAKALRRHAEPQLELREEQLELPMEPENDGPR